MDLLAEHSGGHMEGGTGHEESGVIHLTVSTPEKSGRKRRDPHPRNLGEAAGFLDTYPIKTHVTGL